MLNLHSWEGFDIPPLVPILCESFVFFIISCHCFFYYFSFHSDWLLLLVLNHVIFSCGRTNPEIFFWFFPAFLSVFLKFLFIFFFCLSTWFLTSRVVNIGNGIDTDSTAASDTQYRFSIGVTFKNEYRKGIETGCQWHPVEMT